jgi:tetratricopeptide (TPR) repeat protein
MYLSDDDLTFRPRRNPPYRLLIWAGLIVAALWLLVQVESGEVEPLFQATPTATRTGNSFTQEARAFLEAGNLDAAISAYDDAIQTDPQNTDLMAELAQTLIYSSALQTSDAQKAERLQRAETVINQAAELAPRDSFVHAVRAFVLDWNANSTLIDTETRDDYLFQAEQAASLAVQLDNTNILARIYFAEVLLDQSNWTAAQQNIEAVIETEPQLMDAYRVYGLILETMGLYREAIEAYQKAADLAPNMTFLYLRIGYNYRELQVYNRALEYFDRAVSINNAINVQDPIPYIAIAKTYAQQGEFFIAARNAERAIELNPLDANTYGQLGIIYTQARNYETAMGVLKCATYGCTAEENEVAEVAVEGLPLTSIEVAYYYLQYGSILSSLNQCDQADVVLDLVEGSYGGDPTIASIVAEDREICRLLRLEGN